MDVVQVELLCVCFLGIVLCFIFDGSKFFLSKLSVIVNSDLAVSCHDYFLFGKYKWVNLYHVAVFLNETFIQLFKEMDDLRSIGFKPKIFRGLDAIGLLKSLEDVHAQFVNLFGVTMCNVFN